QYSLPSGLLSLLGTSVAESHVPDFNASDVRASLAQAGAPREIQDSNLNDLIVHLTGGHASLVAAALRWLAQRDWKLAPGDLQALFSGQVFEPAREDARRLVREIVADTETR